MTTSPTVEYRIPEWSLADRFRKARQTAGMDQRQFATALGVSHATYGHWELGTNTPRDLVAVARRVEKLTRIPAAWLLGVEPTGPTGDGSYSFHGKTSSHIRTATTDSDVRCTPRNQRVAA